MPIKILLYLIWGGVALVLGWYVLRLFLSVIFFGDIYYE